MKIFLDENFPLQFYETLNDAGYQCEHVITVSKRGETDRKLADYLITGEYIFFTHDDDFEDILKKTDVVVFISRLPQAQSVQDRIEKWSKALEYYCNAPQPSSTNVYEILPDGTLEAKTPE